MIRWVDNTTATLVFLSSELVLLCFNFAPSSVNIFTLNTLSRMAHCALPEANSIH